MQMNAQSITANQAEFNQDPVEFTTSRRVSLLSGFIRHFQIARSVERVSRRLYTMSDADLQGIGISREEIPARLVGLYSR
jgi:uncharacterized protein YjiS (DUF1127 family)